MASVTIHDVANAAQVSIKTVSRVLNNEPNVRDTTRQQVLVAVEALQYRPNLSARSLAGSKSFLICLFYDNPSSAYVSHVQQGAVATCREFGYHLIVEPVETADPQLGPSVASTAMALGVDGVIVTPPLSDNPGLLEGLEQAGTPYVRIAPYVDTARAASVSMDDRKAAYDLTAYLLSIGHRDIGLVKGHPEHYSSELRFQGYAAALRDQGLSVREDRIRQGFFSFESGVAAAESMLTGKDWPTAVFASNDDMALGVMAVARRMGARLPEDLSIAGFDDTPSAGVVWPPLTTVRQPIAEMAAAAAQLIISGQAAPLHWEGNVPPARMLDFEIVVRGSAAPPGSR